MSLKSNLYIKVRGLRGPYSGNIVWDVTPRSLVKILRHLGGLFHLPTLMHNSLFINNMYVTLLSSTCFEH